MRFPVIKAVSYILCHTPHLVRYGSKPARELARDPGLADRLEQALQSYQQVLCYAPNQVYIGNLAPTALAEMARPWWRQPLSSGTRQGPFGEIVPEAEFYGMMKAADDFNLLCLAEDFAAGISGQSGPPQGHPRDQIAAFIANGVALPLYVTGDPRPVGCLLRGHDQDENLSAAVLLENLAAKASGTLSLRRLLAQEGSVAATEIDYVLTCGEEAVGDRYQRGGGNLAKAIAEAAGCLNSTGSDVKAFCCSPVHALVLAAALVQAGVFRHVAVVGGGSLAKLGMKSAGHLANGMPILEDVLGAMAFLVGPPDAIHPQIRLDTVAKHSVASGSSQRAIAEALIFSALDKAGLGLLDIDRYAVELHNPDITEPAGSGNVPRNNYRLIASLAVMRGDLPREKLDWFESARGLPGFAPTQGHIAAAVTYIGHACAEMQRGALRRVLLAAKGSLFLGKMTTLSDGMSCILEKP